MIVPLNVRRVAARVLISRDTKGGLAELPGGLEREEGEAVFIWFVYKVVGVLR